MPFSANSALAPLASWGEVHGFRGDAIARLAGLHATATLFHPLWLKDGVPVSMWPGR